MRKQHTKLESPSYGETTDCRVDVENDVQTLAIMCDLCRGKLQLQHFNVVQRSSVLRVNVSSDILQLKEGSGHVFWGKKTFLNKVRFQQ
jgi:hypothetical protein